jgi:hypothetical protein
MAPGFRQDVLLREKTVGIHSGDSGNVSNYIRKTDAGVLPDKVSKKRKRAKKNSSCRGSQSVVKEYRFH